MVGYDFKICDSYFIAENFSRPKANTPLPVRVFLWNIYFRISTNLDAKLTGFHMLFFLLLYNWARTDSFSVTMYSQNNFLVSSFACSNAFWTFYVHIRSTYCLRRSLYRGDLLSRPGMNPVRKTAKWLPKNYLFYLISDFKFYWLHHFFENFNTSHSKSCYL